MHETTGRAPTASSLREVYLESTSDRWETGDAYELFMGRWSRQAARLFVEWLAPAPGAHWLEIGCGTGALTQAICRYARPESVVACDPSSEFVAFARRSITECPVTFLTAGTDNLPRSDGGFDLIVSGLVINFVPHPAQALPSMRERLQPGGILAGYVWDYAEGMEFLRVFWDEAVANDPSAFDLDEGRRFPLCRPDSLVALWQDAGLESIEAGSIEVPTLFPSFDAYWEPFLGRTGPAPAYVASLSSDDRERLRLRLKKRLVPRTDGSIHLRARAIAIRGTMAK